jgi:hypothetical protein
VRPTGIGWRLKKEREGKVEDEANKGWMGGARFNKKGRGKD